MARPKKKLLSDLERYLTQDTDPVALSHSLQVLNALESSVQHQHQHAVDRIHEIRDKLNQLLDKKGSTL